MSELPKRLSFVSYAVNGRGLGHLSRQVAIQRWIRRYATFAGVKAEHWFLTTSEADTLLHHEGFAGFKLPSKSVVEAAGISKPAYLALAKQWVWHSVALVRPDVLIVDTFPNGSFSELLGVLDLCRHKALVLRPVKAELAGRAAFRAVAALYDRIVVPQTRALGEADLDLPADRVRHVGPVMRGEAFERFDRPEARRRLGVPPDARVWLVSAGGGGDDTALHLYDLVDALAAEDPGAWWVLAAGPLFTARPRTGPQRVWWTTPDLGAHLSAFDGAISAAGFNAVHELLFAGVPTIFVPQTKIADDQARRVDAYVAAGAARRADRTVASLRAAMRDLLDADTAAAIAEAARRAVPRNHARDAAREILGLCLPPSLLAQAHAELDDALLSEAAEADVALGDLVDLATTISAGDAESAGRDALELDPALELLVGARAAGAPDAAIVRIAAALARKLKGAPASGRQLAEAVQAMCEHPAIAGQWSAITMLIGAIPGERRWSALQLATAWCELADHASSRGVDVLALARLVLDDTAARPGEDPEDRGRNAALIGRVRARLSAPVVAAPDEKEAAS